MKLLFLLGCLLLVQSSFCDDGSVTTKKCEDFLGADTCQKLRDLAAVLHEKASIVADAVKSAIQHHKTKAQEMLAYIKQYMTDRITCENIFSETACKNMANAIQKFHEQRKLLKEAIFTAAQKHYNNAKDFLAGVKNFLVEKAVNFKCEDVLPADSCTKIRDLGNKLKLTSKQVKLAIETAVVNGAATVKDIVNKTLTFMTTEINCANILGATACNNLVESAKKLKEQTILIKEAIMSAVLKHVNNAKDILTTVKNTLVEKAKNFKCTDALTQQQCDFMQSLATKFKLKAGELHKLMVEVIVNGTITAKQIYDRTIGSVLEHLQNVKCEDLVSDKICLQLDNLAQKFHIKLQEVKLAIATAIASGASTTNMILTKAKEFLVDLISCEKVLGEKFCKTLEGLANKLHVSFKKVIEKIKILYATGKESVVSLYTSAVKYIWELFFGGTEKRSLSDGSSFADLIMKQIEKLVAIGKDVKEKLMAQIQQLIAQGKVTIFNVKNYIKELIAKYGPQSDESYDTGVEKSIIEQLKEALKNAHGKAKELLKKLLTKSKEQLEKIKEVIKTLLGNQDGSDALEMTHDMFADMVIQELDDELEIAGNEIDTLME